VTLLTRCCFYYICRFSYSATRHGAKDNFSGHDALDSPVHCSHCNVNENGYDYFLILSDFFSSPIKSLDDGINRNERQKEKGHYNFYNESVFEVTERI